VVKGDDVAQEIISIRLSLPFGMGAANSYLIRTAGSYFLIDTGSANRRRQLEEALAIASCEPGDLKLVILTHGDFDHIGNAAYLRRAFASRIAMHRADVRMAERGDMFWNRKKGNRLIGMAARALSGFSKADRFTPDLILEEGTDLSGYGLDARVLHIPGHSAGSVGILTAGGALFCGDLLENTDKPVLGSIMDDKLAAAASVKKLREMEIDTVYPGHGAPFPMAAFSTAVA
jgi:hydroxyacylglutathione hydrolase